MRKKTSSFISLWLILLSSVFSGTAEAGAQTPATPRRVPTKRVKEMAKETKDKPKEVRTDTVAFYQGVAVGIEVAGVASHLLGSDILNSEVQLQANFKNRFLPVMEVGYGKADTQNDGTNLHYYTAAPYFRVGMDYNVFHKKPYLPGYLYVGLRYAATSFKYDIDGPTMTDPNYGGAYEVPFSYAGQKSSAHWLEAAVGIKVKIYKSFCMGWCVRYKKRLSVTEHENSTPWYVPGFGKNAGTSFNVTYNLIYNLPF